MSAIKEKVYKNLTAADVVIVDDEGIPVHIFEVSGLVARMTKKLTETFTLIEGVNAVGYEYFVSIPVLDVVDDLDGIIVDEEIGLLLERQTLPFDVFVVDKSSAFGKGFKQLIKYSVSCKTV